MKKAKHMGWMVVLAATLLTGCKTDIDISQIDLSAQFDMGLALPVGKMTMTLEDILGMTPIAGDVKYEADGTLLYDGTFTSVKPYHPVDIATKGTKKDFKFLHLFESYGTNEQVFHKGDSRSLTFDVGLHLNRVNDSLSDERIDKVLIKEAIFKSCLQYRRGATDTQDIPASWIRQIDMILSDQFDREKGKEINLYKAGMGTALQYGDTFNIPVDEFMLYLTKDRELETKNPTLAQMNANVIDTIAFQIRILLEAQEDMVTRFDKVSAWNYDMKLDMIKHRAVWGMFSPCDQVRDEGIVRFADEWSPWGNMKSFRVPLYDPEVRLSCVTEVAGQFQVTGNYLYAKDEAKNDSVFALFNGKQNLHKIWPMEECLGLDSEIGDTVALKIRFSKAADEGQIDRLLRIHPDLIGYQFRVDFANKDEHPVARITDNTDITMHINVHIPFAFNDSVMLEYGDTIHDLQLGILSKDSLKKHVAWIDSLREGRVYLALQVENTLPMGLEGELELLDELGRRVQVEDSTGRMVDLAFWEGNKLHIAPPTMASDGSVEKPGTCNELEKVYVTVDQVEALSRVKQIRFHAAMHDKDVLAMQKANPNPNLYPLRIKRDAALAIRLGVAAKADAIFDFNELIKK